MKLYVCTPGALNPGRFCFLAVPAARTIRATVVQALPAPGPDYLLKLTAGDRVQIIQQHIQGKGGVWLAVHNGKVGKVNPACLKVDYEPTDLVLKPPTINPLVQTLTAQTVRPHHPNGPAQLTLHLWEEVRVVEQPPTGPWAVVREDKLGMVDPGCLKIIPSQQPSLRDQLYRDSKTGKWISDLRGRGLHSLPDELFTLSDTSELYAADNLLTALPDALTRLPNLLRLTVNRNKLQAFPEVVLKMVGLENLNLGENDFSSVPRNIVHLQNVKELWLKSLELEELPEEVCLLRKLELLHLGWNNLTRLPGNFAQLSESLTKLLLQNNQFQQFPVEVCGVVSLRELYLDQGTGQKFTVIPDKIGNLRNLKILVLDNNALTSLPATIGHLASLDTLMVQNNQLSSLPNELCLLSKLRVLWLGRNALQRLPEELHRLTCLQSLRLDGNPLSYPPLNVCRMGIEAVRGYMQHQRVAEHQRSVAAKSRERETKGFSWKW
ncbi:PREDICTED: leucine-rich repeat and death domain-containing protein 1-like [Branchiostoma belcheri]|uniref:Leucine-rich repeat and death domain-containing protein 1-like n=1 Tax=Branchiostoma belcheri TaxID=7741 RepID=A0A6P4YYB4_BRABE|nr:PREDICTED: leucine-rich repeat and death domain-containing protein 1-like [Branchiostoma belcheri]